MDRKSNLGKLRGLRSKAQGTGLALKRKKDIYKARENNVMICIITDGLVSREACSIFLINTKLSPKK